MAVLNTIRNKFGVLISVLIAIALLSFIVDFNSLSSAINSSSDKYSVGKINGTKVSYKDYQEQLERQTAIAELLGNTVNNDQQQKYLRDAAWQEFLFQNLYFKSAAAAGIEVGEEEIKDLTVGNNISYVLMYDPVFGGRNGQFDPQNIVDFVNRMDSDPSGNMRKYWDYVQNNVVSNRYIEKYSSLFAASSLDNTLTLADEVAGNNETADIDMFMVPFNFAYDTTVTVSESEIKAYYKLHKNEFKQKDNRDVDYALFEIIPSAADLEAMSRKMDALMGDFASTEKMTSFLNRNSVMKLSDGQYDYNYWYKDGELDDINAKVGEFVSANKSGVSDVYQSGNDFYAARVMDSKALPESVYVKDILVQGDDALVDSLFDAVNKDKSQFASTALQYSAITEKQDGDLGWMNQRQLLSLNLGSLLEAQVGRLQKIETTYGTHIVMVTEKKAPVLMKKVAILKKTTLPSNETRNEIFGKANNLATAAAGTLEGLQAAAKEQGVYLASMNVSEATSNYGAVSGAKEVTRKIFELGKGKASDVLTVNQNYLFVAGVKTIHKAGYATLAEKHSSIEAVLYSKKTSDKKVEEVAEKIKGCATLEEAAKKCDQTVSSLERVAFASLSSSNNEPALAGAVAAATAGKICGPVKGIMGVYVFSVKNRETGSYYTESDAATKSRTMAQYAVRSLADELFKITDSEDNRERFY